MTGTFDEAERRRMIVDLRFAAVQARDAAEDLDAAASLLEGRRAGAALVAIVEARSKIERVRANAKAARGWINATARRESLAARIAARIARTGGGGSS